MRPLRGTTVALLLAVAAGCGVQAQDSPTRLEQSALPADHPPTTVPEGRATTEPVVLFLVRNDQLVPTSRTITSVDLAARLAALLAGPTDDDLAAGLRTAIPSRVGLGELRVTGSTAHIALPDPVVAVGGQEQILALGQIVYTATEGGAIERVLFERDGQVIEVPTADGTVSAGPVTRRDYSALVAG